MNYPYNYVFLDVVKISLDKGSLTGYYIHNGKSVRLQTLFSNGLNYDWFIQSIFISNPLLTSSLVIVHHSIIPITVNGGALRRIVSLKLKRKFWPSNAPYVFLDVVKFSLDKSLLTGYYIHNGKSVRIQALFSNGLNYDWFIQSIFISNPLLTRSLIIVHH